MEKQPRMYEPRPNSGHGETSKAEEVREYIKSFEEPAENLLRQLEGDIEAGTYSHILGIDASGRIPALIVGEYISEVSKRKGLPAPRRLFATPHYSDSSTPQLAELFSQANTITKDGKKVLVIDDTIFKGNSMIRATNELREHSIPFDVGIFLAVNNDREDIERWRDLLAAENLYVGDFTHFSDGVDEGETIAPIVKDKNVLGVARIDGLNHLPAAISGRDIQDSEKLFESRKEIGNLVDELITKLTKQEVA